MIDENGGIDFLEVLNLHDILQHFLQLHLMDILEIDYIALHFLCQKKQHYFFVRYLKL